MHTHVASDGLKLRYAVDDYSDPWRPRETLFLLHAAMGSSRRLYKWVPILARHFRVVRPGGCVRCAVTGAPIALDELKYWSVDLQEAYASPEAVLERHKQLSKG